MLWLLLKVFDRFDAVDMGCQPAEDCSLITRTSADIQNDILWLDVQLFGHIGDDIRLGNGLLAANLERSVLVGISSSSAVTNFSRGQSAWHPEREHLLFRGAQFE